LLVVNNTSDGFDKSQVREAPEITYVSHIEILFKPVPNPINLITSPSSQHEIINIE